MSFTPQSFPLGPFDKYAKNPILMPQGDTWEAKDVFNPAAIVRGDKVYLLYRAEDHTGQGDWNGTSRIGLAVSDDGVRFERLPEPVLAPTEPYELPGGCEDPRVCEIEGRYYLTYTAYDGVTARLCMASSDDLVHWQKHGVMLPGFYGEKDFEWTKAGAILPQRIDGRFVMYFGEGTVFVAYSDDLLHWTAADQPVLCPSAEPDAFDADLVESGPPPFVTSEGIVLLYNGAKNVVRSTGSRRRYAAGQVVFALDDPGRMIKRTPHPFLEPTAASELTGQVDDVVFIEGLVQFQNNHYLYYGMADSRIGVARMGAV